mmetsp:Transcript_35316/g.92362  ORF Transcript_35316/g.92362 Transcript_35316/m.92362 type:complete len:210 (-) Transcript_35316:311-940(-)
MLRRRCWARTRGHALCKVPCGDDDSIKDFAAAHAEDAALDRLEVGLGHEAAPPLLVHQLPRLAQRGLACGKVAVLRLAALLHSLQLKAEPSELAGAGLGGLFEVCAVRVLVVELRPQLGQLASPLISYLLDSLPSVGLAVQRVLDCPPFTLLLLELGYHLKANLGLLAQFLVHLLDEPPLVGIGQHPPPPTPGRLAAVGLAALIRRRQE